MKVYCMFVGVENRIQIELSPETDFERNIIDKLSEDHPNKQHCCSERRLVITTKFSKK